MDGGQYGEDVLVAFLQHRVSLAMVQRLELLRYFTRFAKQPGRIVLMQVSFRGCSLPAGGGGVVEDDGKGCRDS